MLDTVEVVETPAGPVVVETVEVIDVAEVTDVGNITAVIDRAEMLGGGDTPPA